ncbi:RNA-guided endonuclease InsQ/TnpB family protein [Kribbella sp. WER1]
MYPTPVQGAALLEQCKHARYVWNLAVEQWSMWTPEKGPTPSYVKQCRQLTEARAAFDWLRGGAQIIQQQALRDFDQAVKLNRRWAAVNVPKIGWVRFRLSRAVSEAKSYRITRDRAGRWHLAFAAQPMPIPGPGTGAVVGVDRGVTVSAALSTGELLKCPDLSGYEQVRLKHLQRRLARCSPGSKRRQRVKAAIAKLCARDGDRRKDWTEKTSTDLARRFDVIRGEDLRIGQMTRRPKSRPNPNGQVRTCPTGAVPRPDSAAASWLSAVTAHREAARVKRYSDAWAAATRRTRM